jgi:SOS-response transcriptional repressor LexA
LKVHKESRCFLLNFYENLKYWCDKKGISPNRACLDNGLSEAVATRWKKDGYSPRYSTQVKLAEYFGITIEQLNDHTLDVEEYGTTMTATIPVYGEIKAGIPSLAEQREEGRLVTDLKNPKEYFALRVKGDSMVGAGIKDGCSVICHIQNFAEPGQIVACLVLFHSNVERAVYTLVLAILQVSPRALVHKLSDGRFESLEHTA